MTVSGVVRARSLAEFLLVSEGLQPPVPIEDLLDAVADVSEIPWPFDGVDALVPSLEMQRPRVLIRSEAPALRKRFTKAHEYGHIQMLWHGGTRSCATGVLSESDLPRTEEQEADLFASALMAPDEWLLARRRESDGDMTALLDALTELQLSAAACVLALRRVLLAGWVFRIEGLTVSSPGTEFGLASASRSELEDACTASGSSKLQRKLVRWYRMFGDSQPPPADRDPRTATEILRSVLSRYDLEIDSVKAMQRINGKVGGGLSANTGSVQEMYQVLVYRFEASDFEVLLEDPEFHAYLGRKVQDIAHGQTAKRLRRNAHADGGGRL